MLENYDLGKHQYYLRKLLHFFRWFSLGIENSKTILFVGNTFIARFDIVFVVIWKNFHSKSDTNRTKAKGLLICNPRMLYCLEQKLAMMILSQHWVLPSKPVRPHALWVPNIWAMLLELGLHFV